MSPPKHIKFSQLMYEKLIATEGEFNIKRVAKLTGIPAPTLYKYAEGEATPPADLVPMLYNATKDIDYLLFIIDDTDQMLAPRPKADAEKSVLEETLDVAAKCGSLVDMVQVALDAESESGRDLSPKEKTGIIKAINKSEKELEDLRNKIKNLKNLKP